MSIPDYLALPRPDEVFVVEDLLPTSGALLIYGDPKVGKSFVALQLSQAISTGTPWLGFSTTRGRVLYVQLDTPRGLWIHRIEALMESGERLGEDIHIADRESLQTWPFNILNPDHAALLQAEVARVQPDVVIIDTLKESHQLPENDNTDSQRVLSELVRATQPAALVLIHHGKKSQWDAPPDVISGARGASYLTGRMDAICHFSETMMRFVGRAAEGGSLKLQRKDNGYWELEQATHKLEASLDEILAIPDLSIRERAKMLSDITGISVEAARSKVRRRMKEVGHDPMVTAE